MKNEKENKDQSKKQPPSSQTNSGKDKKGDTGNSLDRDAVGKMGSNNPTPQARTDNEQE